MRGFGRLLMHLLMLYALSASAAIAQEDESAWSLLLDSVTVQGFRFRSPLSTDINGVAIWDLSNLNNLPQILGNADPMHYAQMLPGIQTNSEYRSGINIEGCDNQHNVILLEGIPLYNVNHLLGFFSTFNPTHYRSMTISKGAVSAGSPNRLGGQLEMMHSLEIAKTASATVSLGLVSSQGTVELPLNRKASVTASLRGSDINLLYSRWLRADGQQIEYSFYDANVSFFYRPNYENTILIDYYSGTDHADFSQGRYLAEVTARWGNTMGGVHWFHQKGDFLSKVTAYFTRYSNLCKLDMKDMDYRMPSSIYDFGFKGNIDWHGWSYGFESISHNIHPQSVEHQNDAYPAESTSPRMQSLELSIYSNYVQSLTERIVIKGGMRGSLFKNGRKVYGAIDPSLSIQYGKGPMMLSASYVLRHQYLFQTGFSDSGLPTEFWISASEDNKPQYAHELSAAGSTFLFRHRLKLSVDVFYRQLYNQLAYKGSILDYVNTVYDIDNSLLHGKGKNYGFSVMLNKITGKLIGWMSYTFTRARRSFDEIGRRKSYPASHERPHELNCVATYNIGKHYSLGGTLVYASGTPFTAAQSLYLLNNNIVIKYGDYNANRLSPYLRLDLSVNYKWGQDSAHGLNLSLYNVTGHDNELFYYLRTRDGGSFVYRPVTFVLHVLPSVSYNYKF